MTLKEKIEEMKNKENERYFQALGRIDEEVKKLKKFEYNIELKQMEYRLATEAEKKAKRQELEKPVMLNHNKYMDLLRKLGIIISRSKSFILHEQWNDWLREVLLAFESYKEGDPAKNMKIVGVVTAFNVLNAIHDEGIINASKLMHENESKDPLDYDTKLIIKFGKQKGKECYKYSERYKKKLENLSSNSLEEMQRVLG